jgi:L-asparaginase II
MEIGQPGEECWHHQQYRVGEGYMPTVLAEVARGEVIESVHWGHVAVVRSDVLVASGGNLEAEAYLRSAAKPFQAIPLVSTGAADAFAFTTEELALACASHNGTERHQDLVLSILAKSGSTEGDLRCGYALPLDEQERGRVILGEREPVMVQCECSGEHAGMLAACRHAGWPLGNYTAPDHPLQQEITSIIAAACGLPPASLRSATDGCGLPTFAVPIGAMALAYAVLADPSDAPWDGTAAHREALLRLRQAMAQHPELVSGDGETDTEIMRITAGRVIAKLGAEGLLCLAVPEHRLGVAIRDVSGSTRALGPAAVAVLDELSLEESGVVEQLRHTLCAPVRSFSGQVVGCVRPALQLRHANLV